MSSVNLFVVIIIVEVNVFENNVRIKNKAVASHSAAASFIYEVNSCIILSAKRRSVSSSVILSEFFITAPLT